MERANGIFVLLNPEAVGFSSMKPEYVPARIRIDSRFFSPFRNRSSPRYRQFRAVYIHCVTVCESSESIRVSRGRFHSPFSSFRFPARFGSLRFIMLVIVARVTRPRNSARISAGLSRRTTLQNPVHSRAN